MARITLEQWIHEALNDPDKGADPSQIALVHMQGVSPQEVHTVRFSGRAVTDTELANLFMRKAEGFAQDLQGVQTFALWVFYGENLSEPGAKHPFLLNSQPDAFSSGLATEGPTSLGLVQQSMRHAEMLMQQTYLKQRHLDEVLATQITILSAENARLREENLDAIQIVKESFLRDTKEQHEMRMEEERYRRATEERAKWLSFGPPLINTILGREVFPQGNADTALIESIADSLSEDDVQKLVAIVKPELLGPLAARLSLYMEKKEANAKARAQIQASSITRGDPELDAVGGAP